MSSEALYEQYKDALKRGHVAALRGQVDAALLAYAEAARIAPERSTPHASAGTALLRHRRPAEALGHYEMALAIAPRDEAALLGRAQALAALGRRPDAADAYDALADVHAAGGRLADAVDAARRGLELAEGRERRRTLERLIARLRASEPDEPGRAALERALRVLDGVAVPEASTTVGGSTAVDAPRPEGLPRADGTGEPSGPAAAAHADELPVEAPMPLEPGERGPADLASLPGETEGPASPPPSEPEAAAPPPTPDEPHLPAAADLAVTAEAAAAAGEPGPAVAAAIDLAAAHLREGRVDAALDACYAALSFDPDNVEVHLALVEIYAGRGWSALAADKLNLLDRLARLDADDGAIAAVAVARTTIG